MNIVVFLHIYLGLNMDGWSFRIIHWQSANYLN
jgi:hypothetical protein